MLTESGLGFIVPVLNVELSKGRPPVLCSFGIVSFQEDRLPY
jgi:hypothetical protein